MNLQEANTLRKLDREFDLDKFSKAKRRIDLETANETIPVIVVRSGYGYIAAAMFRFHNYTQYSKIPSAAFLHLTERLEGVIKAESKAVQREKPNANVLTFPMKELTYSDNEEAA